MKTSSRVLMVHPLGGMRGPARTLHVLATALASYVNVQVAAPDGFLVSTLRSDSRIDIHRLPLRKSRPVSWILGTLRLRRVFAHGSCPDLIHANGLSGLNLVAPWARLFGRPVFVHLHASTIGRRAALLTRLWGVCGVRMSISPVSDVGRSVAARSGLSTWLVGGVPNPVDLERFTCERDAPKPPFVVGFVGSASPNKGLDLLPAIARVLADQDVTWIIVGVEPRIDVPIVQRTVARIQGADLDSRFVWWGRASDMAPVYKYMDALLVLSARESLPRVALEAMASGLPIVATRIPSMVDALRDHTRPLLFERSSATEPAGLISHLASDEAFWRRQSNESRESVKKFETESVTKLLLDRYCDVSEMRRPPLFPSGLRPGR